MNRGSGRKRSVTTRIGLKDLFETVTQEQERRKIEPGSSAIRVERKCASIRTFSFSLLAAFIQNNPEVDVCDYISRVQLQRPPATVFGAVQVLAPHGHGSKTAQRFRTLPLER